MENVENSPVQSSRFLSIDVFKGLSIALMVFVNTLFPFENVPAWTHHAGDYGLTYVDLIAPFFIFMLALNFQLSFSKKIQNLGRKSTYLRFIRRYLIFLAIGLVMFIEFTQYGLIIHWGTLQVLGISGLIALPFSELKPWINLCIGVVLALLHQFLLYTEISVIIYDSTEGGYVGSLSWGSMMIFACFLSKGLKREKKWSNFLYGGLIFLMIGLTTSFFWGISRQYMSFPYIMISVGISSIIFCLIFIIFERISIQYPLLRKEQIFSSSGKNAFILYILHLLSIYFIFELIPIDVPWLIIASIALINAIIILIVGYFMDKYQIYLVI
jgi:predicted acyltransferase